MRLYKNQIFPSDISMAIHTPEELCNPKILQMNRLSPRATQVPSQKPGIYWRNKEQSERIYSLNGNYNFALFSEEAPEGFEKPDYDDNTWDLLDVPSMWQFRGYGEPTYPNVEYAFPCNPPYICRLNPVGCYRRKFTVHRTADFPRATLHFAGVDNAFYVYLNGEFVGFSKGSRLPAEFDISELLVDGENTIAVKVYTFSDASYLEDQDMLLASGIFRDVYIIFQPDTGLWDYSIITDTRKLTCTATLWDSSLYASARFTLGNESKVVSFENGKATVEFTPENLLLWNAETPNLYDFTIEILQNDRVMEIHSKRVGFCSIERKGAFICVNGQHVLFKGINRHENNCDNGRTITVRQTYDDLKLIKSHNINAIRCSHYPDIPAFYEFASELGIYIMDEADIESHGVYEMGDIGYLNQLDEWCDAFMDRTVRMAERDKNETCVTLWSIGNECGNGQNTNKTAAYLANREDKKPVFYAHWNEEKQETDHEATPWVGTGYMNMEGLIAAHQQGVKVNKPVMLLEYAHAMGNSPGNLDNLWDYVSEHPEICGGYVWEFRGHGKRRRMENGVSDYLYGGDFHDTNHWSNFTLDGYLTSDSTPKPTFLELKYVYAPLRFKLNGNVLTVRNTRNFLDSSDIALYITYAADMTTLEQCPLAIPAVQPGETADIVLDIPKADCVEMFLTITGFVGDEQVILKQFQVASNPKKTLSVKSGRLSCEQNRDKVDIQGENFSVSFANGVPVSYIKNGQVYFTEPMRFVAYRAETDNDGIFGFAHRWIDVWERHRLHLMQFFSFSTHVTEETDSIHISSKGVFTAEGCYTGFEIQTDYHVYGDGLLTVQLDVKPYGKMPHLDTPSSKTPRLPRFGVIFKTTKDFNAVRWFGRGPAQSYTDALKAAPVGVYELPIDQMNFQYDVPQETGSRCDTRFIQVKNQWKALTVYGNNCFSFQYHPWTLNNLRKARHISDLVEDASNYLYIDYRMRALGSQSCGPNPEVEADFEPHDFRFVFALNGEEIQDVPEHFNEEIGLKTQKLTERYEHTVKRGGFNIVECRRD